MRCWWHLKIGVRKNFRSSKRFVWDVNQDANFAAEPWGNFFIEYQNGTIVWRWHQQEKHPIERVRHDHKGN